MILTIGGSGFVGSFLIKELNKTKVHNLDKNPSPFFNDITKIGDIRNIDDIKIYELNGMPGFNSNSSNANFEGSGGNGDGNLPDNIVNAAMRYRAQVPFIDNLLDEIGMSSKEISNIKPSLIF